MRVAIAGASGFIGRKLVAALAASPDFERVIGLSRRGSGEGGGSAKTEWRRTDLADFDSVVAALEGAEAAVYLVHSMSPQARLSQGSFDDFDLLLADNFARAARAAGVRHLVYLGGLLPPGTEEANPSALSDHLRSRLEVEKILSARGPKFTALRAGLVLGPSGSSVEIVLRLVRRLPVMIAPAWTRTAFEPVAEEDVIRPIVEVLRTPSLQGQSWDLTGGETLSYLELIVRISGVLGKRRPIVPVPVFSPALSGLWVRLVTGAPKELVYPLLSSLAHSMRSRPDRDLLGLLGGRPTSILSALERAIGTRYADEPFPPRPSPAKLVSVRSIQRIPFDAARFASRSLGETYFQWLSRFFFGILRVRRGVAESADRVRIELTPLRTTLLEFRPSPGARIEGVERFRISGGILSASKERGRLEFREIGPLGCALAIVDDFVPRLPWFVYKFTQAPFHLFVMSRFRRYCAGISRGKG